MIAALLSGVLTALIFPKFDLYWLAWVALVPFFFVLLQTDNRRAGWRIGLLFGLVFFSIHLFWLTTLFAFVGWWIILGWLALALFQTLFILLFVFLVQSVIRSQRVWAVPFIWVGIEWLRAWGPFGVTGGDLGYSQASFLPLIQIASFSLVYGVSFLLAMVNAGIAQLLVERRRWQPAVIALVLVAAALVYGRQTLSAPSQVPGRQVKVALIQGNIPQKDKLNPALVLPIFNIHRELTEKALLAKPDIVIWPETTLFTYVLRDRLMAEKVRALAREAKVWFVLGTPHLVENKAYNAVISFSPSGEVVSYYYKQHLVPFGEYLPFRPLLYPLLRSVGYYENEFAHDTPPKPLQVGGLKLAAAVCFESTLPAVIRERVSQGTDFILLVTNDAWFVDSSAAYFHWNTGVFRAVENRKYFVQVGNTGFSGVIDPYGRILTKSRLNERAGLTFQVPLP
jgi:apolipoprotein N-acyltransferase